MCHLDPFFGSNYFWAEFVLILSSLLILFRNKLIGSQPSITADKRVHKSIYILCIYNSRHVCDFKFVSSFIKWRKWIKQLLVIYTNIKFSLLLDEEFTHNVNGIVWLSHKKESYELSINKVNDKWAHLVVWASVHKLLCQILYFSKKIHMVLLFGGEGWGLTFHAWKAWYQNDLKFIDKLTNCQEYNLNN